MLVENWVEEIANAWRTPEGPLACPRVVTIAAEAAHWNWVLKTIREEAGLSLQMKAAPEREFTDLD